MPIFHQCVQGTRQWLMLRLAKPTASCFDRIVTPGGKASTSQDAYLRDLIAEMIMGHPVDTVATPWMQRGTELESQAIDFWEFQRDLKSEPVGFVTTDDGLIGASPDRLVGDAGLLELKCPSPAVHVGYLLFKDVSRTYRPQLQGELYVSGREWVEICSYHPEMPPAIVHVERDEEFLKVLDVELKSFVYRLEDKRADLAERGMLWKPPEQEESPDFVSNEDVNMILKAQADAAAKEPPKEHVPHFVLELRAWRETLGVSKFTAIIGAHGYESIDNVPVHAFAAIEAEMLQHAKDMRLDKPQGSNK